MAALQLLAPALTVTIAIDENYKEYVKTTEGWKLYYNASNLKINENILPTKTSQLENDSNFVSSDNLKTINGESIVGSGDITISGEGDYLPSAGGVIDGTLQVNDDLYVIGTLASSSTIVASGGVNGKLVSGNNILGLDNGDIVWGVEPEYNIITAKGDGTKFLANDGTYKTISGGGTSDANIQAVDTGDVLDDVNVSYATTAYVDGLIGDINSVLENIIDGGRYFKVRLLSGDTEDAMLKFEIPESKSWNDCNNITDTTQTYLMTYSKIIVPSPTGESFESIIHTITEKNNLMIMYSYNLIENNDTNDGSIFIKPITYTFTI